MSAVRRESSRGLRARSLRTGTPMASSGNAVRGGLMVCVSRADGGQAVVRDSRGVRLGVLAETAYLPRVTERDWHAPSPRTTTSSLGHGVHLRISIASPQQSEPVLWPSVVAGMQQPRAVRVAHVQLGSVARVQQAKNTDRRDIGDVGRLRWHPAGGARLGAAPVRRSRSRPWPRVWPRTHPSWHVACDRRVQPP